jgi:cytochrome bd-type quinol oxidase subunit 2
MPIHLIFLFLFQSGLAFAFSYFMASILLGSNEGEDRERMLSGMRKVMIGVAVLAIALPPVMFTAYFKSLPEGQPTNLAVWPAAWIFMILLAVLLALTVATSRRPRGGDNP